MEQIDLFPPEKVMKPKTKEEIEQLKKIHVWQERRYNILQNFDGNLMFIIKARVLGHTEEAYMEYDGGPHALLHRAPDTLVILYYINEKIRPILEQKDNVLVVDCYDKAGGGQGIANEYNCEVRHVEKVDLSDYRLLPDYQPIYK